MIPGALRKGQVNKTPGSRNHKSSMADWNRTTLQRLSNGLCFIGLAGAARS